jgi:hypothetical protein
MGGGRGGGSEAAPAGQLPGEAVLLPGEAELSRRVPSRCCARAVPWAGLGAGRALGVEDARARAPWIPQDPLELIYCREGWVDCPPERQMGRTLVPSARRRKV